MEGLGPRGNGHVLCRPPLEEALGGGTCGRANEHRGPPWRPTGGRRRRRLPLRPPRNGRWHRPRSGRPPLGRSRFRLAPRGPRPLAPAPLTARKAARSARSGSSSWDSGAPKSATSPAPETEVTVPPRASTSATTSAKAPPRSSRRSSGPSLLAGAACWAGQLGEHHAHEPALFRTRTGRQASGARSAGGLGRTGCQDLLQGGRGSQPELLQGFRHRP